MNKVKFILLLSIISGVFTFYSSKKDEIISEKEKEKTDLSIFLNQTSPSSGLNLNWEPGTYLVYENLQNFEKDYQKVGVVLASPENEVYNSMNLNTTETDCYPFPLVDLWSSNIAPEFKSMRRAYEEYECLLLDKGMSPERVIDIPIIDDALASMISPDGIIQIGREIIYFSEYMTAKAPISEMSKLKEVVEGTLEMTEQLKGLGIVLYPKIDCLADFSAQVNHSTGDVFVSYTGSPLDGGDKSIVWSIGDGSNNHRNETSFTHNYDTPGTKDICVTYTHQEISPDTMFYYTKVVTDSTFTLPSGNDTTIQIITFSRGFTVNQIAKVICSSTKCRTITIGECNVSFDFTIGIDNAVNFNNLSTVPYGTIDSVRWSFGDGQTSTAFHPSHRYDCDKTFTVTLIVFSDHCPNGSSSFSAEVDASGLQCCDQNPQSDWKYAGHPTESDKKKIKYRYDMGTSFISAILDQDFKAKIKYYEKRRGEFFWQKKEKWRLTEGNLSVVADGDVFSNDEDDCTCKVPHGIQLSPLSIERRTHTFKDEFGGVWIPGNSKKLRMKDESTVYLDYKVDGVTYIEQNCQNSTGFHCE